MTAKQFYDWQTSGGTDDVMRLVSIKDLADIVRLVESHPHLWAQLNDPLKRLVERPESV